MINGLELSNGSVELEFGFKYDLVSIIYIKKTICKAHIEVILSVTKFELENGLLLKRGPLENFSCVEVCETSEIVHASGQDNGMEGMLGHTVDRLFVEIMGVDFVETLTSQRVPDSQHSIFTDRKHFLIVVAELATSDGLGVALEGGDELASDCVVHPD